jgi:hypothetical protein
MRGESRNGGVEGALFKACRCAVSGRCSRRQGADALSRYLHVQGTGAVQGMRGESWSRAGRGRAGALFKASVG